MSSGADIKITFAALMLLSAVVLSSICAGAAMAQARDTAGSGSPVLIAGKTQRYEDKEGFERNPKDIINALKENDVARFQTLLDGLQRSFGLDKTLQGKGPFTLFAPTDRAFDRVPQDDLAVLFANPDKLKQVLSYHVLEQRLSSQELSALKKVKTMEGDELTIGAYGGDLYADKALIKVTDMPCSNGVIHVIDQVLTLPSLR